jgi:hypothetical protein
MTPAVPIVSPERRRSKRKATHSPFRFRGPEFVALPLESVPICVGSPEQILQPAVLLKELTVLLLEDNRVAGVLGRLQFSFQSVDAGVQEAYLLVVAGLVDRKRESEGRRDAAEDGEEEPVLAKDFKDLLHGQCSWRDLPAFRPSGGQRRGRRAEPVNYSGCPDGRNCRAGVEETQAKKRCRTPGVVATRSRFRRVGREGETHEGQASPPAGNVVPRRLQPRPASVLRGKGLARNRVGR